jgi:Domain of unknown function (DUF932)
MTSTLSVTSGSSQPMITPQDRQLFKGTAAQVHDWMSTEEVLGSIGSNFTVRSAVPSVDGREYPDCRLWLRTDNQDLLGVFGNKRQPFQPGTFVEHFRAFAAASDQRISLDLVGSLDRGRTFYMASKLTDNIHALLDSTIGGGYGVGGGLGIQHNIPQEDRSDFWLVITDFYGEARRPMVSLLGNELICSNGLVCRVRNAHTTLNLEHRGQLTYERVAPILHAAAERVGAYVHTKERMIDTRITRETAVAALREFFSDPDGEKRTVKRLEAIYDNDLIGGELPSRQDNVWRLAQAMTQYTTHSGAQETPTERDRALRSQFSGARQRTAQQFMAFLEDQFLNDLVTA